VLPNQRKLYVGCIVKELPFGRASREHDPHGSNWPEADITEWLVDDLPSCLWLPLTPALSPSFWGRGGAGVYHLWWKSMTFRVGWG
jgi:hypothetical protein